MPFQFSYLGLLSTWRPGRSAQPLSLILEPRKGLCLFLICDLEIKAQRLPLTPLRSPSGRAVKAGSQPQLSRHPATRSQISHQKGKVLNPARACGFPEELWLLLGCCRGAGEEK